MDDKYTTLLINLRVFVFPSNRNKEKPSICIFKEMCWEEDKAFLYMYANIFLSFFPLVRVLFFFCFFFWNLSVQIPCIFLLLPFSNLEVNCYFRQHCYSHKQLARLHRPDGLGASFYCWGHLFLLCRSHASH